MMWHGRIKLFLGVWLIISGIVAPLQNPVNEIVVGFIVGICCFRSFRFWQAAATGFVGMWLFYSGLSDLIYVGKNFAVPANFLICGLILTILGVLCVIIHSKERLTEENSLGINL